MPENREKDNLPEIRTSLGQYFLQKKIAQGGMAEIFKGISSDIHGTKKTVVIKKILPHIAANKEFVDMLVSEAKIAVQLSHGNIAQIFDLGRTGQDYFMVMEFVDGKSLSQINKRCLKDGELIPFQYILYFISEVASGLDYMHRKTDEAGNSLGIVHRDISPQNIIVSYSGTVKIIDFGIAKSAFKSDATESVVLKGKFAYMSPEQARGEVIDGRSDIFSLGVILHELAIGRRLFKDKDNKQTIKNVRKAIVEPPSTYNKEIPKEFDDIVMKALSKDVKKRYQNAGEMRDDIIKLLYTRSPDFKSSLVVNFVRKLFGEDYIEAEEEREKENTPLLIVDQTQATIDIGSTHIMKDFMLEDPEEEPKEELGEEILPELKIKQRPEWKKKFRYFLDKNHFLLKYISRSIMAIWLIAVLVIAGHALGWWKEWAQFFEAKSLTPETTGKVPDVTPKFTTLNISSAPEGAIIYIDDITTKHRTPVTLTDIKADGKAHTIGIYLEGHKFFSATFTATPDETIRFSPILEIAYGELQIMSNPDDANVLINGEMVGKTPFKKEGIEPNSILKIAVAKDGFTPLDEEIKVSPGKASVLRVDLMRLPWKLYETSMPIPKLEAAPQETTKVEPERDVLSAEDILERKKTEGPTPRSSFSITEIPLLPAEPVAPPPQISETTFEQPLPTPEDAFAPSQPGAPAPDTRDKKLEIDYSK